MYKKYVKKVFLFSTLALSFLMLISVVYAADYNFYNVGDSYEMDTYSKLEGTVGIKAVHYSQLYNGELEYTLKKKVILFDVNVGKSQKISTYNRTVDIAYWDNCSNSNYKGRVELTKKDSNFSYLYGYLSLVQY